MTATVVVRACWRVRREKALRAAKNYQCQLQHDGSAGGNVRDFALLTPVYTSISFCMFVAERGKLTGKMSAIKIKFRG